MALVLADRVKETSTTTGTGTLTLAGAAIGFQSFSVIGNGNTCYYAITNQSAAAEWEVGIGTYTASGTTLARTTILASSNAGAAVNLSAGTKDVFVTYAADRSVYLNEIGNLEVSGSIKGQEFILPTNTTDAVFVKDDNITSWDYSGKSKSVTAEDTVPTGLYFSPDGTRMYIIGSTGDDVNQYSLSTAWDVTTASFVRVSATIGETAPTGVFFKTDGTVMYITGTTNDTIREFSVSTAWDVSTIAFVRSFSVAAQDTAPQDVWFRADGLKMYMVGSTNDRVYEYNLSTAWNISTATFVQFFSVAAQETVPISIDFASDGTRMYILGAAGQDISRYTLSTPWNISTAVYYNNFYVGFQETAPTGMFIDRSNGVAYVVGSTADTVFQYETETDGIQLTSSAGLFIEGSLYTNKNLVVTDSTRIDGSMSVSGTTTLASTLSVAGTLTASGAVNMNTTTGAITLGTAQTTGTFAVGGTAQTGAITVGQSTGAQTLNIATGATATATTKAVNIGTAGLSGSTTNINIGSSVSGALGDIFLNQPTDIVVNSTTDALRITQTGTGNALLVEDSANPDATPFMVTADGKVGIGVPFPVSIPGFSNFYLSSNDGNGRPIFQRMTDDAGGVQVYLRKGRGTIQAPTIVNSGDAVGSIIFSGWDGSAATVNAAEITAAVDGTPGTNDMPGRLVFSTTADGASSPTERMRIASTGTISLGAAPGAESLRVTPVASAVNYVYIEGSATTATPVIRFQGSDANVGGFYDTTGTGGHRFRTNVYGGAPTQFQIAHTASAVNYLQVTGAATGGTPAFSAQGSDTNIAISLTSKGASPIDFFSSAFGAQQFRIAHTASAVNYLQVTGGATGSAATLSAQGSDTNINIALTPKGTGSVTTGSPVTISTNSTTNALRITQTGTGNALVVEDEANPDATPLVIDASGKLLIGRATSSGLAGLQIYGTDNSAQTQIWRYSTDALAPTITFFKVRGTTASPTIVQNNDQTGAFGFTGFDGASTLLTASVRSYVDGTPGLNDMPGRLVFNTTADGASTETERMRIDNAGNVLFGTTGVPNGTSIYGSGFTPTGNSRMELFLATSVTASNNLVRFFNPNGQVGVIVTTGTSTAYSTSSDYRLKENIAPMHGALARIAQLKPVTYTWKADGRAGQGFIAHELQAVVPDCVIGEKDAVDKDGSPQYQGIDTSFLVATLVAAIQEQQTIITQLQADVAALKGN